jgi:hypothetical protein
LSPVIETPAFFAHGGGAGFEAGHCGGARCSRTRRS